MLDRIQQWLVRLGVLPHMVVRIRAEVVPIEGSVCDYVEHWSLWINGKEVEEARISQRFGVLLNVSVREAINHRYQEREERLRRYMPRRLRWWFLFRYMLRKRR